MEGFKIEPIWIITIIGVLCAIIGAGIAWFFTQLYSDLRAAEQEHMLLRAKLKAVEAKVELLQLETPSVRRELSDIRDAILRIVPRRKWKKGKR